MEQLSHRSAPNLHFCSQTTETQEMTLLTLKFHRSAGCFSDSFSESLYMMILTQSECVSEAKNGLVFRLEGN